MEGSWCVESKAMLSDNPPHVLLVEDNVIALHLIKTLAKQAGLKFTAVNNGEKGLELFQSDTFDLIITDIGLPGMSGYEFSSNVRQWEKNQGQRSIPIIGLTALPLNETKKIFSEAGINEMLAKPISLKIMQYLIQKYLPAHASAVF
jgi:CheY-like chemotaxis protein